MPHTPTLSLLASHAGRKRVATGDAVSVAPDRIVVDGASAHEMVRAHRRGRGRPPRFAERCLFVDGGDQPAAERRAVRAFGELNGVALNLEPTRMGWPGAVAAEEGWVTTGDLVVGTSPDLGAVGGLGALALSCRPPELAEMLDRRTMQVTVPRTRRVLVEGRLPRWVGPLELALHLARRHGDSLRGAVLELTGETVQQLPVEARLALCAALACAGMASLVPADESTRVWLAARRASPPPSGPDQAPEAAGEAPREGDEPQRVRARDVPLVARLDGDWLEPGAREAPTVDEVVLAGSLWDLRQAAEALQERRLRPGLRAYLLPATRRTLLHALEEGLITAFVRAGAILLTPGGSPPPGGRGVRRVTTRDAGPMDVLAGPAVAAASAISGRLVDPETMRREQRRTAAPQ